MGPAVSFSSDISSNSDVSSPPRLLTPQRRHATRSHTRLRACVTTRQFHSTTLQLSDNLLGHSPMARPAPTTAQQAASPSPPSSSSQGPVWGTDSNTAGGGVWAQTSSKKDKLNELLTELNADGVDTGKTCPHRISCILSLHCDVSFYKSDIQCPSIKVKRVWKH